MASNMPVNRDLQGIGFDKRHSTIDERLFCLPAPEQMTGQDVPEGITAVDMVKMRLHEVARLLDELVDEKRPARPNNLVGFLGDFGAELIRQCRKRQAGKDIVGLLVSELADDLLHIRRRPVDRIETAVVDGFSRSSTGRQNVPTPGPYSTNRSHSSHLTGASIFLIVMSDDGMIEPTITGCFRKPLKNTPQGPRRRSTRDLMRSINFIFATLLVNSFLRYQIKLSY